MKSVYRKVTAYYTIHDAASRCAREHPSKKSSEVHQYAQLKHRYSTAYETREEYPCSSQNILRSYALVQHRACDKALVQCRSTLLEAWLGDGLTIAHQYAISCVKHARPCMDLGKAHRISLCRSVKQRHGKSQGARPLTAWLHTPSNIIHSK